MDYRIERDTLGEVRVPRDCYYGAQTQRARDNFPVSGLRLQPSFVRTQAIIKLAAARANMAAGRLDPVVGNAVVQAAREVMSGRFLDQFVVDVFQAGAGTSQNMNMNEVLANRALEILGGGRGEYSRIHPNDHVNMAQSTNDTIHAAIHISAYSEVHGLLLPAARRLKEALAGKARAFAGIVKSGRTHMQDAVPLRLGHEFGAYAAMIRLGCSRVERAAEALLDLCLGGTAVGTGMNADPAYRERAIGHINEETGFRFRPAADIFEAMQSLDAVVEMSGALRVLVTSLRKIAADLILLASGPRTGIGEIRLPAVQPGSSIMPGKVNPVLAEMLSMVCFHTLGCDTAIVAAAQAGQLELNVMMPVVAYNILQEIEILAGGVEAFTTRCVAGIEANAEVCRRNAERSPSLATALSPHIGYDQAAALAKEALEKDLLVRDLVLSRQILDEKTLREVLNLERISEGPASASDEPTPIDRQSRDKAKN
jgi:fumarate hydratase class II